MSDARTYENSVLVQCPVIHGRPWSLAQRALEELGDGFVIQVWIDRNRVSIKSIVDLMCLEAAKGNMLSYSVTAIGDGNAIDQNVQEIVDDAFAKAARGVQFGGDE